MTMTTTSHGTFTLRLGGEELVLLPQRAIWWPSRRTILVADVHWGKDATFRRGGIALPDGDLEESLGRLGGLIDEWGADRLLVLGDLIHARHGLGEKEIERVASWRRHQRVEMLLVAGNHDRKVESLAERWEMVIDVAPRIEGGLALVHEPQSTPGFYTLGGHLHPMVRIGGRADSVRLPCFRMGPAVGILPAFSLFTGGARETPLPGERVFAIAEGVVVSLADS